MKAPKISMPFMEEEEPEVVTMPVARDDLVDRCVVCGSLKGSKVDTHGKEPGGRFCLFCKAGEAGT